MGGFSDSINKNIAKILKHVDAKCYSISFQLFTSIVHLSPSPSNPGEFAQGWLANQWYPQAGSGFSSELDDSISPNGSASLSRITALANSNTFLGKDGAMTLANNVPYSYRAEKLGWLEAPWAGKIGPYAMVAKSLQTVAAQNR